MRRAGKRKHDAVIASVRCESFDDGKSEPIVVERNHAFELRRGAGNAHSRDE